MTSTKPTIPPLLAVTSSAVTHVGHADGALFLRFKGGKLYRYQGVSTEQYAALGSAKSLGLHLKQAIFPQHEGELVKESVEA